MSETLRAIREHAAAGRSRVSTHAMQELSNDNIDLNDIEAGLEKATAVEEYPDYAKGPCVLCLQKDKDGKPIHVLWGLAVRNPTVATIITAYRPDPERWMDDLITRKPR